MLMMSMTPLYVTKYGKQAPPLFETPRVYRQTTTKWIGRQIVLSVSQHLALNTVCAVLVEEDI